MDSKLLFEVCKRIKTAAGIETLLVLAVAALYLAIVSRGVRPDELMTDAADDLAYFPRVWSI